MNSNVSPERPFWLHFILGGALYWGALALWPHSQQGHDAAGIAAAVLCLLSFKHFVSGVVAWLGRLRRRRAERRAARPDIQHGQARWASVRDVKKAGMLKSEGLFLGRLKGRDLYYPGETHLLTIAPPGAGKGVCLAVTNLLLSKISMVVTDPKGELYAMTARHRREALGHKIIALAPWAAKMSDELEIRIPDHGFNPLSVIAPGPDIKDEAELCSSLLLPGKARMGASDEFWNDGGQTVLTAFMLYLAERYESFDLPMLRRQLLQAPEELFEVLDEMSRSPAFGGCLQEYGGKLLGALKNAPQQFEGWLGSAQKALRIYDSLSPLGHHVSREAIDFASLKRVPTTIYLIVPSDRIATHAAWLNLVISLAIELVGRDRSNRRVLFLLDEFANLGYLPNVLRGMAQYRGQGVQIWCIIQQLSQLERLYGREGMREFLGLSEMVNSFGIWEPETLKVISQWLGSKTARQFSQHITPDQDGARFGFNYNAADLGVPLMRPEDIRTMPQGEQLIFYRNLPPIRARKVSYLDRASLRTKADPNPYFRKS